jgi:hypothetical protein
MRILFVSGILSFLLAMPCWGVDLLTGLVACRDVADSATRLACFDRETALLVHLPAAPVAASPPSAAPIAAPPTAAPFDAQQKFGLPQGVIAANEVAAGTRAPAASQLQAKIAIVGHSADGRDVYTLDNGQVWRQLLRDVDTLAESGDAVIISKGLLGSYWLRLKSGRGCKVTRLQ